MLPAARDYARARRRIVAALERPAAGPDAVIETFLTMAADVLAIETSCWHGTDPASGLPVSAGVLGDPPGSFEQSLRYEFGRPDVSRFHELCARRFPAAAISTETRGEMSRSARFREMVQPAGAADELRVAFRDAFGIWTAVVIFTSRRMTEPDLRFIATIQGAVAQTVRAAIAAQVLAPAAATPDDIDPGGPAVLLLDRDDRIVAADATARRRLAVLPDQRDAQIPGVVAFLAARARADAGAERSTARMRAGDGRWLTVDASALDDDAGSVAVVVQPAAGEAVLDGVLRSLGLSERERQVAALCARGQPAKVIAAELSLSPWTVQDHLQAIYAKTGTGTRPELAARFGTLTAAHPAKSAITQRVAESPPGPYTAPASR